MNFGPIYEKFDFFNADLGGSKHLVARFANGIYPVANQLEILSGINSQNLLKATRNQNGTSVEILFDINFKTPLVQVLNVKKMSKEEFFTFIIGTLNAISLIEKYNLPSIGIVFENDFVFVDSNTFEPYFMFAPIYTGSEKPFIIREFIVSLVMCGAVLQDETVAKIVSVFDSQGLSVSDYLRMVLEIKMTPQINYVPVSQTNYTQNESFSQNNVPNHSFMKKVEGQNNSSDTPMQNNFQSQNGMYSQINQNISPIDGNSSKKTKTPKGKSSKEQSYGGKIALMIILQILFVTAIAFIGFKGKLNTPSGEINLVLTITLLGLIVVIDFILYAILFNTKKEKVSFNRPAPRQGGVDTSGPRYMSEVIGSSKNPTGNPFQDNGGYCAPNQGSQEVDTDDTVIQTFTDDCDDTVIINIAEPLYPFLEFEENGELKKIVINKPSFIFGRLHGRVDYISTNKKISKIHSEIISKGNCYYLKDFNSRNKTFINRGGFITPDIEHQIYNNDVISFADSEFVFKIPL